jgi:molybdopterin-binding protein
MATLLTVREAADRLGVAYSTLKQWIYDGGIRTTRTRGGHYRISESEVERAADGRRFDAGASVPSVAAADGRRFDAGGSVPSVAAADGRRWGADSVRSVGVLVALSGRNQLRGIVEEIRGDGLLAQVRLRVGNQMLTAVITRDAVTELKLKRGDEAVAIIKSTEVMIGRTAAVALPDAKARKR